MRDKPANPVSGSTEPALLMNGLAVGSLRGSGIAVAEEINWTVNLGEFWVVAGMQGSGKSDFLMLAGGLMAPLRGQYHFFGEEMPIFEGERMARRLRLGLVFDGGQLFNHLTVRENVALPLRYHRDLNLEAAEPEVERLLEAMELSAVANALPATLARSWQKRVGLARALILRPQVLLVDNPLFGLDFRHAKWWLDFLGQLSEGHSFLADGPMTIVATTADLRPWKGRAHKYAVLKNRRLTVLGDWTVTAAANPELLHELWTRAPANQ